MAGSPLAFGESNVRSRIKNVLNYKKPAFSVVAATCAVTLIFIMGFTANPVDKQDISAKTIDELATVWANALITRDGEPRYEMMSERMKEQFKQEQILRSGENWNFNIGVSSPWVVDFEVEIDGNCDHFLCKRHGEDGYILSGRHANGFGMGWRRIYWSSAEEWCVL